MNVSCVNAADVSVRDACVWRVRAACVLPRFPVSDVLGLGHLSDALLDARSGRGFPSDAASRGDEVGVAS